MSILEPNTAPVSSTQVGRPLLKFCLSWRTVNVPSSCAECWLCARHRAGCSTSLCLFCDPLHQSCELWYFTQFRETSKGNWQRPNQTFLSETRTEISALMWSWSHLLLSRGHPSCRNPWGPQPRPSLKPLSAFRNVPGVTPENASTSVIPQASDITVNPSGSENPWMKLRATDRHSHYEGIFVVPFWSKHQAWGWRADLALSLLVTRVANILSP